MAVLNIALISALLPAILAMPQHGSIVHGPVKGSQLPSGFPTGFPHPSGGPPGGPGPYRSGAQGASSLAPYPVGNTTSLGPTGTGAGADSSSAPNVVTIQSTINVIPQPLTTTIYNGQSPASTGAAGGSGSGSGSGLGAGSGSGSGAGSGSGSGSGLNSAGAGLGEANAVCGPATVTVTSANTVTVTVAASPVASSPIASPVNSQAGLSSSAVAASPIVSSATYQPGLFSAPASSVAPVASPPVSLTPYQAATSSAPISSAVAAKADYHLPAGQGGYSAAGGSTPASSPAANAPPQSPSSQAVVPPSSPSAKAPVASPVSSAPSTQSSSASVPSSGGVKARGLLYGSCQAASGFNNANIGWGADWSPTACPPGTGSASVSFQFVPQLVDVTSGKTSGWSCGNSAYCMGFNEPDICTQGSACIQNVDDAVKYWNQYMAGQSSNLVTPCTTNDLVTQGVGLSYMTSFLSKCKLADGSKCKFQALGFHFYGNADDLNTTPGSLEATVTAYRKLQQQYNIPELWLAEFAPNQAPTSDQMTSWLNYLDDPSNGVTRYAMNGLDTGTGQSLTGSLATLYAS